MMRRTSLVATSPPAAQKVPFQAPVAFRSPQNRLDVAVTLWRLRAHLGGGRAKYLLRVENRNAAMLETCTYIQAPGAEGEAGPAAVVTVPGYASLGVTLALAMPRGRPARAVTEVTQGDGKLVFTESSPPHSSARPIVWLVVVLALCGALWFAFTAARPSVAALTIPNDVRASRPFSVAYTLSHSAEADYSVVSTQGFVVTSGTLVGTRGAFDVALPLETKPQFYDVRVDAHGRLGDAARTVRIVAEIDPPVVLPRPRHVTVRARSPAAHPFAVDALVLGANSVAGGKPVVVYYRVASVDGMLRLIDQYGTVRAEALLDRRGNSILLAPFVTADQDFRVVLHVSRGNAQAEKSIALRVTKERSLDDVLAAARRKNDGPIALLKDTVAPGDPIEIGIVHYEPGMRVALVDPEGQEVAASAVLDDQNEITLTAPTVAGTRKYTVTATYMSGVSQETIVRNLTIGSVSDAR